MLLTLGQPANAGQGGGARHHSWRPACDDCVCPRSYTFNQGTTRSASKGSTTLVCRRRRSGWDLTMNPCPFGRHHGWGTPKEYFRSQPILSWSSLRLTSRGWRAFSVGCVLPLSHGAAHPLEKVAETRAADNAGTPEAQSDAIWEKLPEGQRLSATANVDVYLEEFISVVQVSPKERRQLLRHLLHKSIGYSNPKRRHTWTVNNPSPSGNWVKEKGPGPLRQQSWGETSTPYPNFSISLPSNRPK